MENVKTNWVIDATHSKVQFKVKHLMISNVLGSFRTFEGTVNTTGSDFSSSAIAFKIQAESVDTEMKDRDAHLKSADFFDVEKFPEISFQSTGMKDLGDDLYQLDGHLTIKGVSKPVSLTVEYGGLMTDPWGNVKAGFSLSGKINRKDWGLNWNAALEAGGVLVGEEVKLICDIELAKVA